MKLEVYTSIYISTGLRVLYFLPHSPYYFKMQLPILIYSAAAASEKPSRCMEGAGKLALRNPLVL
jgi:hypothetical protein